MEPILSVSLPDDLEREIFEITARSASKRAFTLLTVSKHVYTWIKPILYETIVYNDPEMFPLTWFQQHGAYIQHLLLDIRMDASDVIDHLQLCPNVSNLAVWTGLGGISDGMLAHMRVMPLTRLSIDLHPFLPRDGQPRPSSPSGDLDIGRRLFADQIFVNITHLDLVDRCRTWEVWCGLAQLPKLTHLALSYDSEHEVIEGALEYCKLLRVLVLVTELPVGSEASVGSECSEIEPWPRPRVVHLACKVVDDWSDGARGQRNLWSIAEKEVNSRLEL